MPSVGDLYVLGSGSVDFTGGEMVAAKGAAVAEGDIYRVTNASGGSEAIEYICNAVDDVLTDGNMTSVTESSAPNYIMGHQMTVYIDPTSGTMGATSFGCAQSFSLSLDFTRTIKRCLGSLQGSAFYDTAPDFTPKIGLRWTPDVATLAPEGEATAMTLKYGTVECRVAAQPGDHGALTLTYSAPRGQRVEAHVPLLKRARTLRTATGRSIPLTAEPLTLTAGDVGGHFIYGKLKVTMPAGASLRWPARQHNPYTKDGRSTLPSAKLVLVLPFADTAEHRITLSLAAR